MSLVNPLAKARGRGSAKDGVSHWWKQRLTAILIALLMVWIVMAILHLAGADYATARGFLSQPLNAGLSLVSLLAIIYHAQLGMQVVIEDYIHTPWLEISLQLIVKFACLAAAVTAVLVILNMTFGA